MPGPGGGSRGGGFGGGSRGGSFGGGSRGGGFGGGSRGPMHHGPMHHGPHHHHHGPIFFGPRFGRRHYGGGGCLGSLMGMMLIPLILVISMFAFLVATCTGGITDITYDEQKFQRYANEQYMAAFSDTDNYEENILIVFTTYDSYDGYECIAWVGDDLPYDVRMMFGDEYTEFGRKVSYTIPEYYEFSLTQNLKDITNHMADEVSAVTGTPSGSVNASYSKLVNNTELSINKTVVNDALVSFTQKTGINMVIVVARGEDVFGSVIGGDANDGITAMIMIMAIIIILIVVAVIKNTKNGGKKSTTDKTDPDAGSGKYDPDESGKTYDPNTGTWK